MPLVLASFFYAQKQKGAIIYGRKSNKTIGKRTIEKEYHEGCYFEKIGTIYDCTAVIDNIDGQFVNFKVKFVDKKI